jgi:hypothetical protein
MEEKAVNSWLDIAPAYLNFLLKFFRSPREAFAGVARTAKVSSDMTSILLGGVALSYLIVALAGSPQLKDDTGVVARWLRKMDYHLLPVVALLGALALAVVCHIVGRYGLSFQRLGGTVEDSVNAALGFSAVYLPLIVTVLCGISWFPGRNGVAAATAGFLLAAFALWYFPWSLLATHQKAEPSEPF